MSDRLTRADVLTKSLRVEFKRAPHTPCACGCDARREAELRELAEKFRRSLIPPDVEGVDPRTRALAEAVTAFAANAFGIEPPRVCFFKAADKPETAGYVSPRWPGVVFLSDGLGEKELVYTCGHECRHEADWQHGIEPTETHADLGGIFTSFKWHNRFTLGDY